MKRVIIALGGNLGDVVQTFKAAMHDLEQNGLTRQVASSILITEPVNCPAGTPDFHNMVIGGFWNDTPEKLLKLCQNLEVKYGRPRNHGVNLSRPLDLDIIAMENTVINTAELKIPHPAAKQRSFVMIPISELIAKKFIPEDFF